MPRKYVRSEDEIREMIERCEQALEQVDYDEDVVEGTEGYIQALYWVLGESPPRERTIPSSEELHRRALKERADE